ncbi:RNA-binding protein [Bryobacterales bacterium F-183]|nr:RNA-binding protein [Bryobacterales bacterium F-183]
MKILAVLVLCALASVPAQDMASGNRRAQPRRPLPAGKVPPVLDFRDVAAASAVKAVNISANPRKKNYIIEVTGNGVAMVDIDQDGLLDLVFLNAGEFDDYPKPRAQNVYRNLGGMRFEDITSKSGIPPLEWAQGVCAGDFDDDGRTDLLITQWGHNTLLRNTGGAFTDESGSRLPQSKEKRWSTGCAFVDYDRDGDLDLVVANYVRFDPKNTAKPGDKKQCEWKSMPVVCGPRPLPAESMSLFRNDRGKFVDVSEASGIAGSKDYYGFTVLTGDFDNDGWTDIYVACDSTPSLIFRNLGNGKFEELGVASGAALNEDGREQAGMGAAAGDYNNDGRLDIFKTNFTDDTVSLYRNTGNFTFTEATVQAGLAIHTKFLGWGAAFLDMDHDGWRDILYVNGHVYPEVDSAGIGESYRQSRVFFWNLANGQFHDLSSQAGSGIAIDKHASRGLAVGDLDNDGSLEIVAVNMHEGPSILKNQAKPMGSSVLVEALTASGRAALGARISLTPAGGGKTQIDEVRSGGFHISQGDFRAHFGTGTATEATLEITWPDGTKQDLGTVQTNRWITVRQGERTVRSQPFRR